MMAGAALWLFGVCCGAALAAIWWMTIQIYGYKNTGTRGVHDRDPVDDCDAAVSQTSRKRKSEILEGLVLRDELSTGPCYRLDTDDQGNIYRVDRIGEGRHEQDLQILPQRVYVSPSDQKWHLDKTCSSIGDQTLTVEKTICLDCLYKAKKKNYKLFHIMNIDPNHSKFRKVTERDVVIGFDSGGCSECGLRFHGEPNPLCFPSCRLCDDKPCYHHGRCCPKRGEYDQEVGRSAQEDDELPEIEVVETVMNASGVLEPVERHNRPSTVTTRPPRRQGNGCGVSD